MNLAPIVMFVYNRPWHTRNTLEALNKNELAAESILYIYSDGPKGDATFDDLNKINEVRNHIRKENWCGEFQIIERKENLGLARSIVEGVSEVIEKHGKIIVLEDDIVTSKGFLKFMNDALDHYEYIENIMHISGYMYPHNCKLPNTFFFNVPLCWGWATWKRSWDFFENDSQYLWRQMNDKNLLQALDKFGGDYLSSQLAHNISGRLNTWFIKWHATVLLRNGFTLYPSNSLVENIGFDNTGVHNGISTLYKHEYLADKILVENIELIENKTAAGIIKDFYSQILFPEIPTQTVEISLKSRLRKGIKKIFYRLFPELIKSQPVANNSIIKNNSYFGNYCKVYPRARISNSIIGNYTYIAENSFINNSIIGKFCSLGPNLIIGWGLHPKNGISTHPMFYSTKKQNGITLCKEDKFEELRPTHIGNDVFIGANVIVLDGVSIGDGAIIGAGSVVSKDIPAYGIAVGSPIRIINYRFDDKTIKALLKQEWWNFNDDKLGMIEKHFYDVSDFLKGMEDN